MIDNKSQLNKTYIIIAVIIGLAILGFGILNYMSEQKNRELEQMKIKETQTLEKAKIEQENLVKKQQDFKYTSCLDQAADDHEADWKFKVKQVNPSKDTLPKYVADVVDGDYKAAQELCIKLYK